ncbi:hypothetical protein [Desertivirga brevis]|uniref:hypothetical protein n=1 Tax=Desertivirga brevis TaxID=2810310 RepID=UPI001A9766C1|nr:hypothetical protein [Pedobacter sp. SYSU D00873]
MNYIKHLSDFYNQLYCDERPTPMHVSLYHALFQRWNHAQFQNPFAVNRAEVMRLSKIGSVNTYTKCMKELAQWGFIDYLPSHSIHAGSRIRMITFDNTTDNTGDHTTDKTAEIELRPLNKHNKLNKTLTNISLKEVEDFFEFKNSGKEEASLFFNHYEACGWMMGKTPIQNWHAAAVKWMNSNFTKAAKKKTERATPAKPVSGNLFVNPVKNYNEAL